MRIGALSACRGGQPVVPRGRNALKVIATSAFCESARDQKDRKHKRSPEKWQSQRRPAHEKGNTFWIDMGLTKAGFLAGLTPELSRAAKRLRLE